MTRANGLVPTFVAECCTVLKFFSALDLTLVENWVFEHGWYHLISAKAAYEIEHSL